MGPSFLDPRKMSQPVPELSLGHGLAEAKVLGYVATQCLQPAERSLLSTPSATTFNPRPCASLIVERTVVSESLLTRIST